MKRMKRPSPLLSFVLALLPACSAKPDAQWVEAELPGPSQHVLFEVARLAMRQHDYVVLVNEFDPVTRTARSGWRLDMHPFSGEGFRERVEVSYAPGQPGSSRVRVRVRVERQVNKNIARPLDPEYADWKPSTDDPARARAVLQTIRSTLGSTPPAGD